MCENWDAIFKHIRPWKGMKLIEFSRYKLQFALDHVPWKIAIFIASGSLVLQQKVIKFAAIDISSSV